MYELMHGKYPGSHSCGNERAGYPAIRSEPSSLRTRESFFSESRRNSIEKIPGPRSLKNFQ